MDVVYQPIRSTTWAVASAPTATSGGNVIPLAAGTIEKRLPLLERAVSPGLQSRSRAVAHATAALQLGLVVRSVHYKPGAAETSSRGYTTS